MITKKTWISHTHTHTHTHTHRVIMETSHSTYAPVHTLTSSSFSRSSLAISTSTPPLPPQPLHHHVTVSPVFLPVHFPGPAWLFPSPLLSLSCVLSPFAASPPTEWRKYGRFCQNYATDFHLMKGDIKILLHITLTVPDTCTCMHPPTHPPTHTHTHTHTHTKLVLH